MRWLPRQCAADQHFLKVAIVLTQGSDAPHDLVERRAGKAGLDTLSAAGFNPLGVGPRDEERDVEICQSAALRGTDITSCQQRVLSQISAAEEIEMEAPIDAIAEVLVFGGAPPKKAVIRRSVQQDPQAYVTKLLDRTVGCDDLVQMVRKKGIEVGKPAGEIRRMFGQRRFVPGRPDRGQRR